METKTCSHCKKTKPIDQFNWKITGKQKQYNCKICQSAYTKEHYRKNPGPYKARARAAQRRARKFVRDYLSESRCIDCGEDYIATLDFDHVRGKKKGGVTMLARSGHSIKMIRAEIAKCEVRCANCHRKRHWKNRNMKS